MSEAIAQLQRGVRCNYIRCPWRARGSETIEEHYRDTHMLPSGLLDDVMPLEPSEREWTVAFLRTLAGR